MFKKKLGKFPALRGRKVRVKGELNNGIRVDIRGTITKNSRASRNVIIHTQMGTNLSYNRQRLIKSFKGDV